MAKINHNNAFETINSFIENARMQNAVHLYAQDVILTGRSLKIADTDCWHFATTGYLGMEQDMRLKQAAADAIMKYGTQFPLSKTYISHPLYAELEELLFKMFNRQVIVCKNSTLAHLGVIPQAVGSDDVVVMDHQVHWSVQHACKMVKAGGVPVHMIRHNNMEQLEDVLRKYQSTGRKVWYMADGIYSMYGDHAPVEQLKNLAERYPALHLYIDDVHGTGWIGKNGTGFAYSHWNGVPHNMVLVTTLSKTFGASGAVVLCGDPELHAQVKNFGGPLTFSAQLEPAAVAAATAAAKIFLSPEVEQLQSKLMERIGLMNRLLSDTDIPLVANCNTPVFYVATAMPQTAYLLVNRLMEEGFIVNPGIFPAVPVKNAGLRITVSNHNEPEHIQALVKALKYHYPQALEQTCNSINTVRTAFRMDTGKLSKPLPHKRYTVNKWNSIADIPKALWNETLGNSNAFDYAGMLFVEKTFTSLPASSYNLMTFWYYGFFDTDGDCVGLVGMSEALWKEDMLAKPQVSQKIEEVRKKEPLFLVELAWSSGTTFSEGVHLYLKDNCTEVLSEMIRTITADFDKSLAEKVVFRDFVDDANLNGCFLDKGFVQVEMPDTAVAELNDQNFSQMLSKRNRRHLKEEVLPYTGVYTITLTSFLTPDELKHAHGLYLMVKDNNLAINNFPYEEQVFDEMNQHSNWYFLKAVNPADGSLAGCMFCYYNDVARSFSPVLIGMDEVPDRLLLYRQLLYHTLLFAVEMKCTKSYLGLSASFEKKKMGARIIKKYAYVQAKDTYSSDLLATFE